MGEHRTPVRDRGHLDLVSDPGSRDLVRDGAHRDLTQGRGLQDLLRDLGLQEAVKVGAVVGGKLREVPATSALRSLPSAVLFERELPQEPPASGLRPGPYLPMIGPACDRGEEDLLRDPGRRDLSRDGISRDLRFAPGVQDRVRDPGARELRALGAIRSGTLPPEILLSSTGSRSGAIASRPSRKGVDPPAGRTPTPARTSSLSRPSRPPLSARRPGRRLPRRAR